MRIATEQQRLALLARDQGCISPGCDVAPYWCETHHITDWALGGKTSVDNLALLCGANHRDLPRNGWTIRMINGRPWLVPPPWIDPDQKPIRNTLHD
jgi:HNH endonuclease